MCGRHYGGLSRLLPIVWTQILNYFSLYAAGHFTFEASKVNKNACQSRYVPFHSPSLIKKQRHFVLFDSGKLKHLLIRAQNHCVKGLVLQFVLLYFCFLIGLALGIDGRSWQRLVNLLTEYSKLPTCNLPKRCVHTIGFYRE